MILLVLHRGETGYGCLMVLLLHVIRQGKTVSEWSVVLLHVLPQSGTGS